jgi:hypothetical protein
MPGRPRARPSLAWGNAPNHTQTGGLFAAFAPVIRPCITQGCGSPAFLFACWPPPGSPDSAWGSVEEEVTAVDQPGPLPPFPQDKKGRCS